MKTFNQFITEGRDAPLYHSLRFSERVSTILTNRQLIPTTEQNLKSVGLKRKGDPNFGQPESEGRVTGISTTRSLKYAKRWGKHLILVLDQKKLSHNYRIIPWNYWYDPGEGGTSFRSTSSYEYEEFVVTSKPIDYVKYATKVLINPVRLSNWVVETITGDEPPSGELVLKIANMTIEQKCEMLSKHLGGIPVETF